MTACRRLQPGRGSCSRRVGAADAAVRAALAAAAAPSVEAFSMGAAFDVMSSKAKLRMSCFTPFSSSSKSLAVRPLTTAPFRSRTTTSTRTRLTALRNTGACVAGAGCWPPSDELSTKPMIKQDTARRIMMSVPESRRNGDRAHRPGGRHLAE